MQRCSGPTGLPSGATCKRQWTVRDSVNEKALAGKSPIMAIDNYPMDSDSNDQPATRQADVVTEHQQSLTITRTWQGPLPDPESLAHYERVAPGAAERILAVFERQVKHRLSMEARDSKRRDWGLALAFIVVILLVATGAWLVFSKSRLGWRSGHSHRRCWSCCRIHHWRHSLAPGFLTPR